MFSSLSFIVTLKKIRAFAINQYIFNNLIKIVIQQKNIVATLVHVKLECNKCVWKVPVRSKGSKRRAIIVLFSSWDKCDFEGELYENPDTWPYLSYSLCIFMKNQQFHAIL